MPVCFLDMDGVLCDFVGGALKVHSSELPMADVRWDFPSQIGFKSGGDPEFWRPLGREFWAGLDWCDGGKGLVVELERWFGKEAICLMTAGGDANNGCHEGKLDWIRREMPGYERRVFFGPSKHLAAGRGKVLVDDHDHNIDMFTQAGGAGFLWPRPWNRSRDSVAFTVESIPYHARSIWHSARIL